MKARVYGARWRRRVCRIVKKQGQRPLSDTERVETRHLSNFLWHDVVYLAQYARDYDARSGIERIAYLRVPAIDGGSPASVKPRIVGARRPSKVLRVVARVHSDVS